jgi:hypothetical protein
MLWIIFSENFIILFTSQRVFFCKKYIFVSILHRVTTVASTAYYGNLEDNEPLGLQFLLGIGKPINLWQHS